jgi:hypothetical protein
MCCGQGSQTGNQVLRLKRLWHGVSNNHTGALAGHLERLYQVADILLSRQPWQAARLFNEYCS